MTITGLRDGAAYERLARRVQTGDLRAWAADIDGLRHEVTGKLLLPVDWSPMREVGLTTVPADGRTHEPALYMEDSAWPYEAKLDAYLEMARTHYAPSLEQRSERSLLTLLGVFQAALGAARAGARSCCGSGSTIPNGCPALFTREPPAHVRARERGCTTRSKCATTGRAACSAARPGRPSGSCIAARVRTTSRSGSIGLRRRKR